MAKIVTFGEVLLRLSTPGFQKLAQANSLDLTFGGTEMNVGAALVSFGHQASHVTAFPPNLMGIKAKSFIRSLGIDDTHIQLSGDRIGLFFLETGAVSRASQIVYDRSRSSFSELDPAAFNWEQILTGADWFHWCGITPAISKPAADALLNALQTAKKLGVKVSSDIYYRSNLWNYGLTPQEILPNLAQYSDIILASRRNLEEIFGIEPSTLEKGKFQDTVGRFLAKFPNVKLMIDTDREQVSASHNRLASKAFDGKNYYKTESLDVTHIVDRIGTGDAFLGGFIHAQLQNLDTYTCLQYGNASSALKHTIPGDQNLVGLAEVEALVAGDASGRLRR